MAKKLRPVLLLTAVVALVCLAWIDLMPRAANSQPPQRVPATRYFGAAGDGVADDTAALQRAIEGSAGHIRLPKGVYRITRPLIIDLAKTGFASISGDGVARIEMAGPGPALKFIGTHGGTASPATVNPQVWQRERTPSVDGIEIVGRHEEACGIEATGTMQLTLTRVVVRDALHGIHLVERNRNVLISECHLYDNRGIGIFLDRLNLHQINVANCHISYNDGGGIVSRKSEIRNLQIGTCDIEGNMGGPDSQPTANVLLDSTDSSIGEVAIVGCTIQHSHDAPDSANIRFNGLSNERPFTEERRHGNITIADNVLSDVQVNIEVTNARAVTITGNTVWKGYQHNLKIDRCANVVLANNVFDRNPRYHYGDGAQARLALVISETDGGTIIGNHIYGVGDVPAALVVRNCRRMNITGCNILDYGRCGLMLEQVTDSRVSDCIIRDDRPEADGIALKFIKCRNNMIVDNMLSTGAEVDERPGEVRGNVYR